MYDQRISVVIYSEAYDYILATLISHGEELNVARTAFDFHTFVSLCQSEDTSPIPSESKLTTKRIGILTELNIFLMHEKANKVNSY